MPAEIVSTEVKHRGWTTFLIATIRFPDGSTVSRAIEDHGNAVCVLPYDPVRRTAILVQQLRAPALYAAQQQHFLEAIAGSIDAGEEPEGSARREAVEEAGLQLRALGRVATAWAMPGVSTEQMDLFLGEYGAADRVSAGGGIDGENIEVLEIPLSKLAAMADSGALHDMKTLLLLQTLRLRRPELFGPPNTSS
ncbi:MAG: NUDIX domain-containing protein [Alphaproteobacteria bacterium]